MDKNALKKQHFWFLTGLAPLLTLIAVVIIWTDVGGAIEKRSAEIEKQKKELAGTRAPGQKVLKDFDAQTAELAKKKNQLWLDNWQRQSVQHKLFDWPVDNDPRQRLRKLELRYTKFGEPINDTDDAFEVFKRKDVYEAAYAKVADSIRPTSFLGGRWQNVLRHVSDWGQKRPTSAQIWLALEDLWVQRGLLKPIQLVNQSAAQFQLVPAPAGADDPFHRTFRNKIWELELWIDKNGGDNLIQAKLTNRTDRLQLLGIGNTMRLKVWLSDQQTAQPVDFRIEGEFVPAQASITTKPNPRLHGIPAGTEKQKITRVEQVLDTQTVPIRRLDIVEIGTLRALDARHHSLITALKPPAFLAPDPAATASSTSPPGSDGSDDAALMPPGPGPGATDPRMIPGAGQPPGITGNLLAGPPETVLLGNKNRYLEVSPQVRRMPFAVSMVVDQMFMQDVLVAYANSPLRCQITQFYWQRFRGSLKSSPTPGRTPGPGAEEPGYIDNPETYVLPLGPGPLDDPRSPGFASRVSTVSEGQVTSGLVQLTIHGILTLYEKYEEPKSTTDPTGENPSEPGSGPAAAPANLPVNSNTPEAGANPAGTPADSTGTPATTPPNPPPVTNPTPTGNPPSTTSPAGSSQTQPAGSQSTSGSLPRN